MHLAQSPIVVSPLHGSSKRRYAGQGCNCSANVSTCLSQLAAGSEKVEQEYP